MSDVLITPASSKIEFKDTSNNIDGVIELDASGNLKLTAPNAGISLGDTTSDIYIGDGTNNIDIVFEQSGEIRALSGKTLTLGQSNSFVSVATDLTVNGDVNSTSDIKLKTNIKTLTNSLDKILQMRGVEYDRIDLDKKHQIGVIAQEIEQVVPELVSGDDIKSVSYGNITALLIESIKEQQKQINILTKKIEYLDNARFENK